MIAHDDPHKQLTSACQAARPRPGAPAPPGAPYPAPGAACPYAQCPNRVRVVRLARMVHDLAEILADAHPQKKGA